MYVFNKLFKKVRVKWFLRCEYNNTNFNTMSDTKENEKKSSLKIPKYGKCVEWVHNANERSRENLKFTTY